MGKRHQQRRALEKTICRKAMAETGIVVPIKEARRVMRDPGYKETELGELRSTIRKLTEQEIMERVVARATWEIQKAEDERIFAFLETIQPPRTRYDIIRAEDPGF